MKKLLILATTLLLLGTVNSTPINSGISYNNLSNQELHFAKRNLGDKFKEVAKKEGNELEESQKRKIEKKGEEESDIEKVQTILCILKPCL